MTVTTKRSIVALLLSLVLVVSLFTLSISATDTDSASATEPIVDATTDTESGTGTEKATEKATEAQTQSEAEILKQQQIDATTQTLIINGVIIGVIILIIAVVAIKFRKRLGDFFRSVKSEMKKIVWSSKENTNKGFLVVAVVAIVVAVLIFIIDWTFNQSISMLDDLINLPGQK